ncbi:MAG: hypothetical protein IPK64_20965 [bacterium]|nr:hypothetical protein [bacterium]
MSAESDGTFWSAVGAVAVVLAIRLIDWILPSRHHFDAPWIHDENDDNEEDTDG